MGQDNALAPEDARRDAILDSIEDGVFTVSSDWHITYLNRAAEQITGVPRDDAIGRPCCEVLRASACEADCPLRETMRTGMPTVDRTVYIVNAEGRRLPISISTAVLRDENGRLAGGVETFRDLSVLEELRSEIKGRWRMGDMISRSDRMRKIFEILPRIAASDSTCLILGESGTGKELLARAIHDMSQRAPKPFVVVSCGALPDTLLESELFGYVAGAFTGAAADRQGRFAAAQGGTIFLDEIGDVSSGMQVKLLRVLQEKTYEPLGSNETLRADVRVVAATHRDLAAMTAEGSFRRDLYYRINVVDLVLPPLRERREDIVLLVERFIERFNALGARSVPGVSHGALAALMAHDFPGNIRELENAIERAFVLCGDGPIRAEHLPREIAGASLTAGAFSGCATALADVEKAMILNALEETGGNKAAAARILGIHKTTLFRKLKAFERS